MQSIDTKHLWFEITGSIKVTFYISKFISTSYNKAFRNLLVSIYLNVIIFICKNMQQ